MQSFLQYSRFRTAVEKQYGLGKEKAFARAQEQSHVLDPRHQLSGDTTSAPPFRTVSRTTSRSASLRQPREDAIEKDLEKGGDSSSDSSQDVIATRGTTRGQEEVEEPRRGVDEDEEEEVDEEEPVEEDGLHNMRPEMARLRGQLSHMSQASVGVVLGNAMTGVEIRRRTTNEGGERGSNVFIVGYHDDQDPMNPHNWSVASRIGITMMVASVGFVVGLASAIDSSAVSKAAAEFGVSEVTEICATGLYLIGFGAGALFAGPISETIGRNPVYITTVFLYIIFEMASGLSPNIGAQLAFRFLAGFFASTPLTCAGGTISDLWSPMQRTYAFPAFANASFSGPIIGPVIGGFIAQSSLISWRWVDWISLIMSGLVFGIIVLFLPETFPPVLLKWKAKHMRDVTGDDRYRAEVEVRMDPFMKRLGRAMYRPFLLTVTEPIVACIAIYMTILYIILFTFLDGYNYIFGDIHHTSQGVTGLCFLGIEVGLCCASLLVPVIARKGKKELQKIKEAGGDKLPPEFRLWFAMYGAPAIPISLFWMGWTSDGNISIWSPIAASVPFGFGILCVFISSYQYIIDSYEVFAASALASISVIRYVAAGGMTIVGVPMYSNLGVHWSTTILACLAVICTPMPYVFYRYGPALRKRSNYAPTD